MVAELVQAAWPKIKAQCPGIDRYAESLTFQRLDNLLDIGVPELDRVDIALHVADDAAIPNSYMSHGHVCSFGVGAGGNTLRIRKDACVSLCLDKPYKSELNATDYFRSL
jgi:hypothetical protein